MNNELRRDSLSEKDEWDKKFENILDDYINHSYSLFISLPELHSLLLAKNARATEDYKRQKAESDNGKDIDIIQFSRIVRDLKSSYFSLEILPESFFVSSICQFESFLNQLIKFVYLKIPGILDNSESILNLSDIRKLDTIKEAEDLILEKEIEKIAYKNLEKTYKSFDSFF
ncbi:MAG: hypothetical protein K8S56_09115, partial [Candidatus Cloacimonetes bacterium]|nr:hypothetical protein [Candidatus Cloacimonadota bacterium]